MPYLAGRGGIRTIASGDIMNRNRACLGRLGGVILWLASSAAGAAEFSVGEPGDPACTHTDLQAALAAAAGDPAGPHRVKIALAEIETAGGTFVEDIYRLVNPAADISIEGNFASCADAFSRNDGQRTRLALAEGASGRILRIDLDMAPERRITLRELTLSGGDVTGLAGNLAWGGALRVDGGTVILDRSSLTQSRALRGGGAAVLGNGRLELINAASVGSNRAIGTDGRGGGLYCAGNLSSLHMERADVLLNHSEGNGGGIHLDDCGGLSSAPSVLGFSASLSIASNSAGEDGVSNRGFGGGIYSFLSAIDLAEGATLAYGSWLRGNAGHRGGALYVDSDNSASPFVSIGNAAFTDNIARDRGGAIFVRNQASVSVFHTRSANCELSGTIAGAVRTLRGCSIFAGNRSLVSARQPGGAVLNATSITANPALIEIQRSLLTLNQDSGRAAIAYVNNGRFRLRNSIVIDNAATGSAINEAGPFLFQFFEQGPHLLQHNTVLANGNVTHMAEIGGSQLDVSGSVVVAETMDLWNPQTGASLRHQGCLLTHPFDGSLPAMPEEIAPGFFSDGVIQSAPPFAADFAPQTGNLALDACNAERIDVGSDFYGRPRGADVPGVVNFPFAEAIGGSFPNDLGAVEAALGDDIFEDGFENPTL